MDMLEYGDEAEADEPSSENMSIAVPMASHRALMATSRLLR